MPKSRSEQITEMSTLLQDLKQQETLLETEYKEQQVILDKNQDALSKKLKETPVSNFIFYISSKWFHDGLKMANGSIQVEVEVIKKIIQDKLKEIELIKQRVDTHSNTLKEAQKDLYPFTLGRDRIIPQVPLSLEEEESDELEAIKNDCEGVRLSITIRTKENQLRQTIINRRKDEYERFDEPNELPDYRELVANTLLDTYYLKNSYKKNLETLKKLQEELKDISQSEVQTSAKIIKARTENFIFQAELTRIRTSNSQLPFKTFATELISIFGDTNSTGIKNRILKEVNTLLVKTDMGDEEKFNTIAQLMRTVAKGRVDNAFSKSHVFFDGRSDYAQALYNLAAAQNFEQKFKINPLDFLTQIRIGENKSTKVPETSFNEFYRKFKAHFGTSNSTAIQKVIKRMETISASSDETFKYTDICKFMHDIATKRENRFASQFNRTPETRDFYKAAIAGSAIDINKFVDSILDIIPNPNKQPGEARDVDRDSQDSPRM